MQRVDAFVLGAQLTARHWNDAFEDSIRLLAERRFADDVIPAPMRDQRAAFVAGASLFLPNWIGAKPDVGGEAMRLFPLREDAQEPIMPGPSWR